jgi:hypothetical protein
MLGSIYIGQWLRAQPGADWVICGGETGQNARPANPDWVRSLRDQCAAAGVPFFFKQHGEWLPKEFQTSEQSSIPARRIGYVRRDGTYYSCADLNFGVDDAQVLCVGKKYAGCLIDGREHKEFPK